MRSNQDSNNRKMIDINVTHQDQIFQPVSDPLQVHSNTSTQFNFQTLPNGSLQLISSMPTTNIPLGLSGIIIPSNNQTVPQLLLPNQTHNLQVGNIVSPNNQTVPQILMPNQGSNLQVGNLVLGPEIRGSNGMNQRLVLLPKNMFEPVPSPLTTMTSNNLIPNANVSTAPSYQGTTVLSAASTLGTTQNNLTYPVVSSSCGSTDRHYFHLPEGSSTLGGPSSQILVITPITPKSSNINAPSSVSFGSQSTTFDTNTSSVVQTRNVLLPSTKQKITEQDIDLSSETIYQSRTQVHTIENTSKKDSTASIVDGIKDKLGTVETRNTFLQSTIKAQKDGSNSLSISNAVSNESIASNDMPKTKIGIMKNTSKIKKNLTILTKEIADSSKQSNKPKHPTTSTNIELTNSNLDSRFPLGYRNPFDYSSYKGHEENSSESEFDQKLVDENSELDIHLWKCKMCSETQSDKFSLIEHYEYHKRESDKLQIGNDDIADLAVECPVCFTEFTSIYLYDKHINAIHRDGASFCNLCKRSFVDAYFLSLHNNHYHSTNPDIWTCPLCNSSYKTPQEMRDHMTDQHDIKQDEKYSCEVCRKTFTSLSWFNDHKQFHIKNHPYQCTICEKMFLSNSERTTHYKKAHNKNECLFTKYQCKICKITLPTRQHLKKHDEYHEKKPHLCNECGKITYCQDAMRAHMLRHVHCDDSFECYTCGHAFKRKENLIVHLRIHTGHKPYKCKICGKSFNQRSPLRIHMRIHTGEKPYKCVRCNRGFASKGICDTHRKNCRK